MADSMSDAELAQAIGKMQDAREQRNKQIEAIIDAFSDE